MQKPDSYTIAGETYQDLSKKEQHELAEKGLNYADNVLDSRKNNNMSNQIKHTLEADPLEENVYEDIIEFLEDCEEYDYEKFYNYLKSQKERMIKSLHPLDMHYLVEDIEVKFPQSHKEWPISRLLNRIFDKIIDKGDF